MEQTKPAAPDLPDATCPICGDGLYTRDRGPDGLIRCDYCCNRVTPQEEIVSFTEFLFWLAIA